MNGTIPLPTTTFKVTDDYNGKKQLDDGSPLGILSRKVKLTESYEQPRDDGKTPTSREQNFTVLAHRHICGDENFDLLLNTEMGDKIEVEGYWVSQGCKVRDYGRYLGQIEITSVKVTNRKASDESPV